MSLWGIFHKWRIINLFSLRSSHKLEANVNLILFWYLFSFIVQNIQVGLCSILWRPRLTNVRSVLKSSAPPLTIEDIHLYITDSKSLTRFFFRSHKYNDMYHISDLSSCIYPFVFSLCYAKRTPFFFLSSFPCYPQFFMLLFTHFRTLQKLEIS